MHQLNTEATVRLSPINNQRLNALCGPQNEHIHQLEKFFRVTIHHRSNIFEILGNAQIIPRVKSTIEKLYQETARDQELSLEHIFAFLKKSDDIMHDDPKIPVKSNIQTLRSSVRPRGQHQQDYIDRIRSHDMNFGIGPAGTGKTYLAVACAIEALEKGNVLRLVFVRPAVEAGENLGFLPGDLEEKILPYLRPIYDALYEMMGFEQVGKLVENKVIEMAPLAYMRGRTLNNAFIILDEAQNTTVEQMKMFLTRIGFGSKVVITGDITQIDLPRGLPSGLVHAINVLKDIDSITFTKFDAKDAVRHPLVQTIIEAYDRYGKHKEAD